MIAAKITDVLCAWADSREPDYVVGGRDNPYMERHWLFKSWGLGIYVHVFKRSDDDRALHDHPWPYVTRVLRGMYFEHTKRGVRLLDAGKTAWSLDPRRAHRVELWKDRLTESERRCYTLFIRGPKVRNWGFLCPRGWVPWEKFVARDDSGSIGKGCDQ